MTEYAAALNAITHRVDASLQRASALPAVDFPPPPLWTAAIIAETEEWRALQAEAMRLMAPEEARGHTDESIHPRLPRSRARADGMTQSDVATRLGVDQSTVLRWESGISIIDSDNAYTEPDDKATARPGKTPPHTIGRGPTSGARIVDPLAGT